MSYPENCVLLDISETGARLLLQRPLDGCEKAELTIVECDLRIPCEIVWQQADTIGVRFLVGDEETVRQARAADRLDRARDAAMPESEAPKT